MFAFRQIALSTNARASGDLLDPFFEEVESLVEVFPSAHRKMSH